MSNIEKIAQGGIGALATGTSPVVSNKYDSKGAPDLILEKVSELQLDSMSKSELSSYGEKISVEILQKINQSAEKITKAKRKAAEADEMKVGIIFGPSNKEKTNAVAQGLVATNEAVHEMNELMRALISYTQINGKLSKVMNSAMARMMAQGFTDHDGDIIKLNQNGEEFAQIVMQEAEDFANRQLEVENMQAEQARKIEDIRIDSFQRSRENESKINELKSEAQSIAREAHENISHNKNNINENKYNIDSNKASIELNNENISTNKTLIEKNSVAIDSTLIRIGKNEKLLALEIKLIKSKLKGQENENSKLESKIVTLEKFRIVSNVAMAVSFISLLTSVALAFKIYGLL